MQNARMPAIERERKNSAKAHTCRKLLDVEQVRPDGFSWLGVYSAVECDQTTVRATLRITCREEVGQLLQGRIRFFLRWRLQYGNSRDCSVGAFSARRRGLGIFAVAEVTQLPVNHLHLPFDRMCGMAGGTSVPNSIR